MASTREREHPGAGLTVLPYVVLDDVHPALVETLAGGELYVESLEM